MVTFRARDVVVRALAALDRARNELEPGSELDTVIVDNASHDGTVERVRQHAPWAHLIESPRNAGFAAACNVGIASSKRAQVIVLLNPDVEVRADFFSRLARLDWPSHVAARGPAIFDEDGRLEQSARGFPKARTALLGRTSLLARARPRSRLLQHDLLADADGGARAVDWVSGACVIVPTEIFRSVGPLDEGFFMYWEDADWCLRARRRGYTVIYEPALVAVHHQGASSRYRRGGEKSAFHPNVLWCWCLNVARSRASIAVAALALSIRCVFKLIVAGVRRILATDVGRTGR
jgi:N-acetylglucosaminyl-diphospho-decaprenol L-rhamnosyltransferase